MMHHKATNARLLWLLLHVQTNRQTDYCESVQDTTTTNACVLFFTKLYLAVKTHMSPVCPYIWWRLPNTTAILLQLFLSGLILSWSLKLLEWLLLQDPQFSWHEDLGIQDKPQQNSHIHTWNIIKCGLMTEASMLCSSFSSKSWQLHPITYCTCWMHWSSHSPSGVYIYITVVLWKPTVPQ